MKKLFLFVTAFLFAVCVIAQEDAKNVEPVKHMTKEKLTIEQRAQRSVDRLNNLVTLTDEQKTKVYGFAMEREKKIEDIKGKHKLPNGNIDKESAKPELKAARREYRHAVKGILTQEQKDVLKAKAKANRENKKDNKTNEDKNNKNVSETEEIIPIE